VFQRCLRAALKESGKAAPGQYIALGPSVVRNSLIAEWTATLSPERAAELAGIQLRSLRATPFKPKIAGDDDSPNVGSGDPAP
jgi:hypothetical protein